MIIGYTVHYYYGSYNIVVLYYRTYNPNKEPSSVRNQVTEIWGR